MFIDRPPTFKSKFFPPITSNVLGYLKIKKKLSDFMSAEDMLKINTGA
jgi:hypothetical protein